MSSKYKILMLTFIITAGFLARDTVMISGPIHMMPTYIIFFVSLILSFIFIILTENKKTHNHAKLTLATTNAFIAVASIFLAYILEIRTYDGVTILQGSQDNIQKGIDNIMNYGFVIVLVAVLLGILVGSNRNLRTTYSYKSSKHITSQMPYQRNDKKYKKR